MFNLTPFLSYAFINIFTPGPNNITSMTNAKSYGLKNTFRYILGMTTGFAVIMLLCSYFNLFLFNLVPNITLLMEIIGTVYMLYLAFHIYKKASNNDCIKNSYQNSFWAGFILQFVNPKLILFGITVISTFVIPYFKSNFSLVLFSLFLALVGFWSITSWAIFGVFMQKFLTRYQKTFDILMALLLVYCSASIWVCR